MCYKYSVIPWTATVEQELVDDVYVSPQMMGKVLHAMFDVVTVFLPEENEEKARRILADYYKRQIEAAKDKVRRMESEYGWLLQ